MRFGSPLALGVLASLLTFAPPLGASDTADVTAVIDQVAEAYGGREALAAFPGFLARGKVLSLSDGLSGTVRLELTLNGDLRSEIRYPHRMETRILAGTMAWSGGGRHQRPAEKHMNISMQLQYHRLVAPFELVSAEPSLLVREEPSEEGWIRLRRDWSSTYRTIYEIDPETGRIVRTRGEFDEGTDTIRFETESHDFRDVDGVMFPFRMTTTVSGHAAADIILDSLTAEDDFDPQRFVPEGSAGDI